ncbi:MAG TPA: rRNA maturation RNase YbeY [Verrucomicrobiae bacterium]|jgi:probable rRNA maturation factor
MKAPTANSQVPGKLQISNITILNRQQTRKINLRLLKKIIAMALDELKIENAELEINLVCAMDMARLNEKFLQHEGSTDVITFDYVGRVAGAQAARPRDAKNGTRGRAARAPMHGEIFICVDEAIVHAKKFKTVWQAEIVRYIIHGILHLLGHNDLKPDLRRKMKREENRLLRHLSKKISLAQIAGRSKISA